MIPQKPSDISVIDPISPAIKRVKAILFKPFESGKWFVIGFCAWLAYLGNAGGSPNFNFFRGFNRTGPQPFNQAKEFIIDNLAWLIPTVVLVLTIGIAIWLLITWLSSRGRFMFLHCVAQNRAEVKVPWIKLRQHANSLFLFRIVLTAIAFLATALLCFPTILLIIMLVSGTGLKIAPLTGVVSLSMIILALSVAFLLVYKFTTDFVVPIMFLRTTSCIAAWREFTILLKANTGKFTLYILFQIVISLAVCTILFAAMCLTCCCAACVLAIPYIGTVLMLPLLIFKRSYSLYYFRQFGQSFDLFINL